MSTAASDIGKGKAGKAQPQATRGQIIPPQSVENGYDQNWYPICLSSELVTGQIMSVDFMNGRVIAIRDSQGKPHVLSAFCRHLGADLVGGDLVEDTVRCPYHHWRYDMSGQCVATAIDKAPAAAKLFRFPVHEGMGIVWAFNGTEPLFDPPAWEVPESEMTVVAMREQIEPADHFVPFSNSCDIQHLIVVHGMKLDINPEGMVVTPHSIQYLQSQDAPGMGHLDMWIRMHGSSTLLLWSKTMGRMMYMMSCGRPLPGNRTQIFQAAATPKRPIPGDEQMAAAMINQSLNFARQLMKEDGPTIQRISFRQDILTNSDRVLAMYFDWVRAYPRSSAACPYIAT
jgi:phenylpropionate dioxygenase-like ring-hydroxylating dioxygenase large terminal subunit